MDKILDAIAMKVLSLKHKKQIKDGFKRGATIEIDGITYRWHFKKTSDIVITVEEA